MQINHFFEQHHIQLLALYQEVIHMMSQGIVASLNQFYRVCIKILVFVSDNWLN
jgi:hypothetical protein